MQVDRHFFYLWQLDSVAINRVVLELGKYKGLELTELFEARKPLSTLLKRFPSIVQSTNRSLQNLRMHLTQMRELLLSFRQGILLTVIRRKRLRTSRLQ